MLTERTRHKRPHISGFHSYEISRIGESTETESCQGLGGERGMTANQHGFSFEGDGNVLELGSGNDCITLWIKASGVYDFKMVKMVGFYVIWLLSEFLKMYLKATQEITTCSQDWELGRRSTTVWWTDGREQRAELRDGRALSRTRLSYSFLDTCKVHKISLFALVPGLHRQF